MKIVSFMAAGGTAYGVVAADQDRGLGLTVPATRFMARYPTLRSVLDAGALAGLREETSSVAASLALDDVHLIPPLHDARKVICVGINYPKRDPLDNPAPPPQHIILFAKLDGTLVGHRETLELPPPPADSSFDYEGEITLVVGRAGRHIAERDVFNHIAGYTIMNDGSVREWQKHSVHAGKNFSRSGACGPWMVTADEIADPRRITLQTRLNGDVVQETTGAEMIFTIPELVSYISNTIELLPGDLVATGSPEGAGGSRTPPRFLRAGDTLEIECSGIGVLSNRVGAPAMA